MASDAYWSATKPNGMPDYVWKAQQEAKKAAEEAKKAEEAAKKAAQKAAEEAAKKKAEEEAKKKAQKAAEEAAKKKAEEEAAKLAAQKAAQKAAEKAAEEEAKKRAEAAKKEVGNKPNTTNPASATKAEGAAPVKGTTPVPSSNKTDSSSTTSSILSALLGDTVQNVVNKVVGTTNSTVDRVVDALADSFTGVLNPKPDNTGLTSEDARDEKLAIKNNTTPDYAVKDNGYVPVADLNRPTNGSGETPKVGNTGLTTDDARKEHINIMNDPTINPPTDGQISAGAIIPQETIDQITQLIQNNKPTVDPYVPTDYVKGDYTPLFPQSDAALNPTLNTTSDAVAQYALAIMQAAKGDLGEVVKPEYMQADKPNTPELRTLEELANTYGITYDYDSIYSILNDSVEKQYDAIYARQKQNEDAYYDNATAAQNTLLDTLSRDRSSAVQAGVSKGMQAANALGAMLGVSQQFANNATALSQERSNTAKDYGASLAKAVVDAEATSNERKNAIMEIAKMLYGYDSEQYVANMDSYNTILTNNAALQQTYMNNKTALQNALASIYNSSASSKITGDANIQSNQAIAEANRYAAYQSAEAQRYAAYQAAEANKQAAAYAAQGNVDAYEKYANALIQQALIGSGQSSLAGYEVPQTGSTGTGTNTGTNTTANKNPIAYTNASNAANNTAANIAANLALKLIGK